MVLEISGGGGLTPRTRKSLEALTERILEQFGRPDGDVSLRLTHAAEIRKLNRRFRGVDQPTNVLSFTLDEEEDGILGEVVICIEKAESEAREADMDLPKRLHELMAHGLLHLLGYDHETDPEDRWIKAEQKIRGFLDSGPSAKHDSKDSRS